MMANPSDEVKQRAVRFDYVPQPVGEGHKQNYPKEAHYLAFVGRAGSESLKGTELAEKLKPSGPDLLEAMKCCSNLQMRIERRIHGEG